jgi:hypothetical protein
MTTYSLGETLITIPRFDVMFSFSDKSKVMLHDSYMKYFAYFCFFGGLKMIWWMVKRTPNWFRMLASNIMYKNIKGEKHVLLIGFGDIKSISTTIIDTFIKLGYKIVCLYNCFDNETQTKATSLVSEENLKSRVEIYKEEDFFNDKTTKKIEFEFIFDISHESIPFISESKTNINLEKASLKLINYQKVFEYCLSRKYIPNVKIYQFFITNKPFSPTNRYILDTKEVYLRNFSKEYEYNISVKNIYLTDPKLFSENNVHQIYKYSDMKSYNSFQF